MVPCLLALGSYLGYIASSLALLGAIPCMLVVQHPWLLQVSLHLKSRLLGNGGLTLLSTIFVLNSWNHTAGVHSEKLVLEQSKYDIPGVHSEKLKNALTVELQL